MKQLKVIQKLSQILSPLLINMIGKKQIFCQIKKTGIVLENSKTIALNILYVPCNIEEIRDAYTSKHN